MAEPAPGIVETVKTGARRFEIQGSQLGEGGEARVYLARDPTTKDLVALRILKSELESLGPLFRHRARLVAGLGHPHIVRILEIAREDDAPVYVAMSFAPNKSLRHKLEEGAFTDSSSALRLLIQLAEACHFAHQRGVLHGDLSPSNVLFDAENEPVLTDFGGGPFPGLPSGGTHGLMAPEKEAGGPDTIATDVYGLGALLRELLRQCPQKERQVQRGLRVATVATDAAPGQRHESALQFAQELGRVLRDEPLQKPRPTRRERLVLAFLRSRTIWLRSLLALVCVALAEGGVLLLIEHRADAEAQSALGTYRDLATEYADHTLIHLKELTSVVQATARDPEVIQLLADPTSTSGLDPVRRLRDQLQLHEASSVALFNWNGRLLTRYPSSGIVHQKDFSFRDYYRGVKDLAPEGAGTFRVEPAPYISRAYRGEASCGTEFSITAPILDEQKHPLGFLLVSIHARHTFERIGIARFDAHNGIPLQSALFAERSRDRPNHEPCAEKRTEPGLFIAVVHPNLYRTREYPFDGAFSAELRSLTYRGEPAPQLEGWERDPLVVPRFVDPVTQVEQMGAFAPVGRTSLAVGVFTERSRFRSWASQLRPHWPWLLVGHLILLLAGLWARKPLAREPAHKF